MPRGLNYTSLQGMRLIQFYGLDEMNHEIIYIEKCNIGD